MRHIPEDELHAYLDQALSRSQCVEIEQHLAQCAPCQWLRDQIAALRDRTTALLTRIAPPPIVPPPFDILAARHAGRRQRQDRRLVYGAWAASILGAALLGWGLNRAPVNASQTALGSTHPRPATIGTLVAPVGESPSSPAAVPASSHAHHVRPGSLVRLGREGDATPAAPGVARTVEVDLADPLSPRPADPASFDPIASEVPDFSAQPMAAAPELAGLWRTFVPDSSAGNRSTDVPLVPGLAVLQMRVQPGRGDDDVTAVDQALDSGELIRTIAGPAGRVGRLVEQNGDPALGPQAANTRVTVTIRQGNRMVAVTGPSEALGSLLSRVHAKRRY